MNIQNNTEFKKLFESIKKRYEVGGEEDRTLIDDMKEAINNMITAIELGRGDEAFAGLFLPKMNRIYEERIPAPACISCQDGCVTLCLNPQLIFMMANCYEDFSCIIQHEIYHLVFKHLISSRNYPNHDRTNIAMDTAINQHINMTPHMAEQCYTYENFCKQFAEGKNVERKREFEYYFDFIPESYNRTDEYLKQLLDELDKAKKELDEAKKKAGQNGSEENKENNNSGSGSNSDESGNNENKPNESGNSSDQEGDEDSNQNKNGNGKGKKSKNNNNQDSDSNGSSDDGMSDVERAQKKVDDIKQKIKDYLKNNYVIGDITHDGKESRKMDQSVADRLLQEELLENTLEEAKNRGKIPGSMQSMIDNLYFKEPIISWKKELRHIIGSVPCPYKKTMRVKNRRMPNRADILGRVNDRIVKVAVAVDTSGSVSDDELKYFFNELFNLIKDVKTEVTLIQCDAEVTAVDKIKDKNDVKKIKVAGRGGTCFEPVFQYIKENVPKYEQPSVIIYFTDGYGERQINPKYKTADSEIIWILTGYDNNLSVETPEYRKKIRLLNIENKKYL